MVFFHSGNDDSVIESESALQNLTNSPTQHKYNSRLEYELNLPDLYRISFISFIQILF